MELMKDEFLNNIGNKDILLVCPEDYKNKVLEYLYRNKMFLGISFMTIEEYRKNWYFDYDISAVLYLQEREGLSIDNAREILSNLYYVDSDKVYHNQKLDALTRYKRLLEQEGLLIHNPLFRSYLQKKRVIVAGYGQLDPKDQGILCEEVYDYKPVRDHIGIFEYDEIEAEVNGLYDAISDLLYKEKIEIDHIFVLAPDKVYESYFKRFNDYYGFKIAVTDEDVLAGTGLGKNFLEMIDQSSREEIYSYLKDLEDPLSEQFIQILNRYPDYEPKRIKEYLRNDLEHTVIRQKRYRNVVHCVDFFTTFDEDDYVFLPGFNDKIPLLKNDTDYITDNLRQLLSLANVEEENERIRKNAKAYLLSIRNLQISWNKRSPFESYNENNLFSEKEKTCIPKQNDYHHSEKLNRLRYGYMLERYHRFHSKDEDFDLFHYNYRDKKYNSYDHRFNGLNKEQIQSIGKITLSYSTLDTFYHCQFRYYLDRILNLNEYEDTFYTSVGTLCHEVLKDMLTDKSFDFEKSWNLHSKDSSIFADERERFFAARIKEELKADVQILLQQKKAGTLNQQLCEESFLIPIDEYCDFKGYIDKVMYKESEDEVIASVVDYKTGTTASLREKLMPYGLSLQLPSYMYLLRRSNPFHKKIRFGGFYLQYLINNDRKYDKEKSLEQRKWESLQLDGYTTDDMEILDQWDHTYRDGKSEVIRGLKLKKDGTFHSGSKVMSEQEMDEKIQLTDEKIREAADAIHNGDFRINPKQIDGKNESCEYCPYQKICYRNYNDLIKIPDKKEEEN